jgi:hypothetical protein
VICNITAWPDSEAVRALVARGQQARCCHVRPFTADKEVRLDGDFV